MAFRVPSSASQTALCGRRCLCALAAYFALLVPARAVRPNDPFLSLSLADLGLDTIPARLLVGGATMFTLHFVDNAHVLLTFNAKGLLARLPDATPADDDRFVNALLIEIPSGKVLARTQWRTRDREQYLWALPHGRFLLRIRASLTVIDPLGGLADGKPFAEARFLELNRRVGYISVSPGGDLLAIETVPPRDAAAEDASAVSAALSAYSAQAKPANAPQLNTPPRPPAAAPAANPVEIHFFRLAVQSVPGQPDKLIAQSAGVLASRALVQLPATAEGFLDITQESASTWLFDFQTHDGKRTELSAFDTTCAPKPYFVSRTEFVSFGCHGSDSRISLSGFNLRGEQPWIQVLPGTHIATSFASAPAAGRFAFSRITVAQTFYDLENLTPDELNAQVITVLQHHDGRTLLRVQATPIQRAGQNFDLSPDGLSFAVLRADHLEVYHLPPLTPADVKQLKLADASAPPVSNAIIRLSVARPAKTPSPGTTPPGDSGASKPGPAPQAPAPAAAAAAPPPAPPPAAPPADEPRAPPTLYTPKHPR